MTHSPRSNEPRRMAARRSHLRDAGQERGARVMLAPGQQERTAMNPKRKFDPKRHDENPEWTARDFAKARPALEVLPAEVIAQFKTAKAESPIKRALTKPSNKQRRR